jgi:hypothetical protein
VIYPRPGKIPPNVPKLLDDPPELANVWQNLPSVQSPVNLNRNSVMCFARDLLIEKHSQITHLLNAAFQNWEDPPRRTEPMNLTTGALVISSHHWKFLLVSGDNGEQLVDGPSLSCLYGYSNVIVNLSI